MKVSFIPDIIFSGSLGLKHQLTNCKNASLTTPPSPTSTFFFLFF